MALAVTRISHMVNEIDLTDGRTSSPSRILCISESVDKRDFYAWPNDFSGEWHN
jgi:hypothetical protein